MRVILIDPIIDPMWDAFIDSHPEGIIYHYSVWAKRSILD
jgi:hypothetical protein